MNAQFAEQHDRSPLAAVEALIAEHGAWSTLRAVVAAMVLRDRGRARRLPSGFNDHLRRDIGLEPEVRPRMYWELRR